MNERFGRELHIFEAALKAERSARAALLTEACGPDAGLRARVESLLQAHEQAMTLLDGGEGERTAVAEAAAAGTHIEKAGDRIGRYKLLQQIGEGGYGVVHMAEQEEPVRRRVALKVIKLGMDTKSVIARFEAERQALALMDHPNIAKVFDAGATETGRPYFVMELVRGVRLTDYCDEAKLQLRERLELFIQVCGAIQHAHQKGIIHRDIKPSNILVTVNDGVATPKVIDFGIAKATNQQQLTDKTLFTAFEQFIGTPAYMSPEQAVMTSLDIDTRSDIYALGVLLYELIAGRTPFDAEELMRSGIDEIRRTIREVDPPRPSTRVSTMAGSALTTVAARRRIDPGHLAPSIRGDLDWIVMKCLEKDRTRRYETANGLAADVRRHLNNEPVAACPPSAGYRLQKTIRRNKLAFAAGAAILAVLIAATAFSSAAFVQERQARIAAAEAERAREEARRKAEGETVRADTAASFITSFLETTVPDLYKNGHTKSVKQMVATADRLASMLSNSPLAEARLRFMVAAAYDAPLFESGEAVKQFERVEVLARAAGEGQGLAELARVRGMGNKLWNFAEDPDVSRGIVEELIRVGKQESESPKPDLEKLSFCLSVASEYEGYYGDRRLAEHLAKENVRIIRARPDIKATAVSILYPHVNLINLSSIDGRTAEAETHADNLFSLMTSGRLGDEEKSRRDLIDYLHTVWIMDPTHFPRASLERFLRTIEPEHTELRALIQGRLGVAIARSGEWTNGLALLQTASSSGHGTAEFWTEQICLEALLGAPPERIRTVMVDGLTKFAGGSDFESARLLAETLLMLFSDVEEFRPAIANLFARTEQTPPWAWNLRLRIVALWHYRFGTLAETSAALDKLFADRRTMETRRAWAEFARAAVEARLGNLSASRAAYERGMEYHSPALMKPGSPFRGNQWNLAIWAEVMRREAERLLGDLSRAGSN